MMRGALVLVALTGCPGGTAKPPESGGDSASPDTGDTADSGDKPVILLEAGFETDLTDWGMIWEYAWGEHWRVEAKTSDIQLTLGAIGDLISEPAPGSYTFTWPDDFNAIVTVGWSSGDCHYGCSGACPVPPELLYRPSAATLELTVYETTADIRLIDAVFDPDGFEAPSVTVELLEVTDIPMEECPYDEYQ